MSDVRRDHRYVAKCAADCAKAYKQLQKTSGVIQSALQEATGSSEHSEERLAEWKKQAAEFQESVKALKSKIQTMRTFASRALD